MGFAKDLTSSRVQNLDLLWDGRTYSVRPPSAAKGELMMRCITLGIKAAVAINADPVKGVEEANALFEDQRVELESVLTGEHAVEQLALNPENWERMVADELPLSDIKMLARYAMYYWVYGKDAAEALQFTPDGDEVEAAVDDVVLPKPSQSGPSMESEARSRMEATVATISRKKSGRSSSSATPTTKRASSAGSKSVRTGTS